MPLEVISLYNVINSSRQRLLLLSLIRVTTSHWVVIEFFSSRISHGNLSMILCGQPVDAFTLCQRNCPLSTKICLYTGWACIISQEYGILFVDTKYMNSILHYDILSILSILHWSNCSKHDFHFDILYFVLGDINIYISSSTEICF